MIAFIDFRRVIIKTIFLFYLWPIIFINLCGCMHTNTINIKQAGEIDLSINSKQTKSPPKSLGDHIEYLVKMNSDIPEMRGECGQPEKELDNQDLDALSKQFKHATPWVLRNEANRIFQQGNARHAAIIANYSAKLASGLNCRARAGALADKAKYLSSAGDFELGQEALDEASQCLSFNTRLNKVQLMYELARAESAVFFAKGDIETTLKKLYEALNFLEKEGRTKGSGSLTNFNFRGRWREADVMISIAEVMLFDGNIMEAEIWARKAASIPAELTLPRSLLILGEIFLTEGKMTESKKIAQTVLNMLNDRCVTKDALIRARTHQLLAKIFMGRSEWYEALYQFELIENNMVTDDRTFMLCFDGTMEWGLTLAMTGRLDESLSQLQKASKKVTKRLGKYHYLALEIRGIQAMVMAELGFKKEALSELNTIVIPLLKNWHQGRDQRSFPFDRYKRLRLIVETYLTLINEIPKEDVRYKLMMEKGFEIITSIHNIPVATSIAQSSSRFSNRKSKEYELIRTYQDLEKKLYLNFYLLNAYYENAAENRNKVNRVQLEDNIVKIKSTLTKIKSEIKKKLPKYEKIINTSPVSFSETCNFLSEDESLLVFFSGQNSTFAWAVSRDKNFSFIRIPLGCDTLSKQIYKIRNSLNPINVSYIDDIPRFDIDLAAELYGLLLKPTETVWKRKKDLIIVLDAPLDQMPFEVLVKNPVGVVSKDGFNSYHQVPWLIRSHSITVLPAISSLQILRTFSIKNQNRNKFAGFGDPIFDPSIKRQEEIITSSNFMVNTIRRIKEPQTGNLSSARMENLPPLPETADEVIEVAKILGADLEKDLFLQDNASEKTGEKRNFEGP